MKVIHTLGWYLPDSQGGTESYVRGLAQSLKELGLDLAIAAPWEGQEGRDYEVDGIPVHRYPAPGPWSRRVLQDLEDPAGTDSFRTWLGSQKASLYHQHSITTGCGRRHLEAAKALGLATVLTVHLPGQVCMRGTMLLHGAGPCDGRIEERRCASCWLGTRGLGQSLSRALSRIPPAVGEAFLPWGRPGTALGASALARAQRNRVRATTSAADRVVAVCQWMFDALLLNGVPPQKLVLHRQGVAFPWSSPVEPPRTAGVRAAGEPLVIGFLGRFDPMKGLGLLAEAFAELPPGLPIELRIHASKPGDKAGEAVRETLAPILRQEPRIRVGPALSHEDVPGFLASIDVLAVPSQVLETGPLVVLEAFAAGRPVLGSRLGGIQELVQDGLNGLLVPHAQVSAWRAALERLLEPGLVSGLAQGIGPVRSASENARDTLALYEAVQQGRCEP